MGGVARGQVFLRVLLFSLVGIILLLHQIDLYLRAALTIKTNWQSLRTFQKQYFFGRNRGLFDKTVLPMMWSVNLSLARRTSGHCLGNIREVNFYIPPSRNNIFYLKGLLLLHGKSVEIFFLTLNAWIYLTIKMHSSIGRIISLALKIYPVSNVIFEWIAFCFARWRSEV